MNQKINKKALYENIMRTVSKTVKRALNERMLDTDDADLYGKVYDTYEEIKEKYQDATRRKIIKAIERCINAGTDVNVDVYGICHDGKYACEDAVARKLGYKDADALFNAVSEEDPGDVEWMVFQNWSDEFVDLLEAEDNDELEDWYNDNM